MPDPIFVEGGILVPSEALEAKAIRSSGPGGQNVNKVSSKIELRVRLDRIKGLDHAAMARLLRIVGRRLDGSGRLLVTSQRTRDQYKNLIDARKKVHDWIARAVRRPRPRVSTRPTSAAGERRLRAKHRAAEIKEGRRQVISDED
jgi:ribosome-associated protein